MPPKAPSQLAPAPPRSASLIIEVGNLWRYMGLVMDAFRGRGITEVDMAGSLALQEYGTTYTIASGVINLTITGHGGQDTATPSAITVDTEGGAASDLLTTMNGGRDGQIAIIRALSDARTVEIEDGTGNFSLSGANIVLDTNKKFALVIYNATLGLWIGEGGTGAGGGFWAPLTNGDPVTPEILFDSNGDVIMGFVP